MEIKDFIIHFGEVFEDTDTSILKADTNFRELDEWGSLIALSVMSMVDDEYDVQLSADEMRQANTIQELFDIVSQKQ